MKVLGGHKAIVNYLKVYFGNGQVFRPGVNYTNPRYPYAVVQFDGEEVSIDNSAGGYDVYNIWIYQEPNNFDQLELDCIEAVKLLDGKGFATAGGDPLFFELEKGSDVEGVTEQNEPFKRFTITITKKFY